MHHRHSSYVLEGYTVPVSICVVQKQQGGINTTVVVKLRQMLRVHHRTILRVVKKQQNKSSVVKMRQYVAEKPHQTRSETKIH